MFLSLTFNFKVQRYGVISNLTNKEKGKRYGRGNMAKNQEVIRRSFESKATVRRKKSALDGFLREVKTTRAEFNVRVRKKLDLLN